MSHNIPDSVSANQRNEEQCRKFLAGNRSCFYRGFWKNSPYKDSEISREASPKKKTKHSKN